MVSFSTYQNSQPLEKAYAHQPLEEQKQAPLNPVYRFYQTLLEPLNQDAPPRRDLRACLMESREQKTADLKVHTYLQSIDLPFLSEKEKKQLNDAIGKLKDHDEKIESAKKIEQVLNEITSTVESYTKAYIRQQKLNNRHFALPADKSDELKKLYFFVEATCAAYDLHTLWQETLLHDLKSSSSTSTKPEIFKTIYDKHCQNAASLSTAVEALNYRDLANTHLFAYSRIISSEEAAIFLTKLLELQSAKETLDAKIRKYLDVEPYHFSELLMEKR